MKFALVALIATVIAKTTTADASDYTKCEKGGDCGGSNICCGVTKTASAAPAAAGLNICVPALGDGTVPLNAKS